MTTDSPIVMIWKGYGCLTWAGAIEHYRAQKNQRFPDTPVIPGLDRWFQTSAPGFFLREVQHGTDEFVRSADGSDTMFVELQRRILAYPDLEQFKAFARQAFQVFCHHAIVIPSKLDAEIALKGIFQNRTTNFYPFNPELIPAADGTVTFCRSSGYSLELEKYYRRNLQEINPVPVLSGPAAIWFPPQNVIQTFPSEREFSNNRPIRKTMKNKWKPHPFRPSKPVKKSNRQKPRVFQPPPSETKLPSPIIVKPRQEPRPPATPNELIEALQKGDIEISFLAEDLLTRCGRNLDVIHELAHLIQDSCNDQAIFINPNFIGPSLRRAMKKTKNIQELSRKSNLSESELDEVANFRHLPGHTEVRDELIRKINTICQVPYLAKTLSLTPERVQAGLVMIRLAAESKNQPQPLLLKTAAAIRSIFEVGK